MTNASLPLVLEDGSRLDWPDAVYQPRVRVAADRATIVHDLAGAPSLERQIAEGFAKWAVEIRCPKTLLSRIELSSEPTQTVKWQRDELDGVAWIVPGLLAVQKLRLPADELDLIWSGESLQVPSGWWLALGTKRKVTTLAQSLLQFFKAKDMEEGRMMIQPELGSGEPRFTAHVAADLWADVQSNRTLQVAALIAACGHFPKVFGKDPEQEPAIAREIRERLERAGALLWTDEEYDPALAATAIEPFYPTPTLDDEEV